MLFSDHTPICELAQFCMIARYAGVPYHWLRMSMPLIANE